jgi:hypothetical protein
VEDTTLHLKKHIKGAYIPIFNPTRLCFNSDWSMARCTLNKFSTCSFKEVGTNIVGGFMRYKPRVATYIGRPPFNQIKEPISNKTLKTTNQGI